MQPRQEAVNVKLSQQKLSKVNIKRNMSKKIKKRTGQSINLATLDSLTCTQLESKKKTRKRMGQKKYVKK